MSIFRVVSFFCSLYYHVLCCVCLCCRRSFINGCFYMMCVYFPPYNENTRIISVLFHERCPYRWRHRVVLLAIAIVMCLFAFFNIKRWTSVLYYRIKYGFMFLMKVTKRYCDVCLVVWVCECVVELRVIRGWGITTSTIINFVKRVPKIKSFFFEFERNSFIMCVRMSSCWSLDHSNSTKLQITIINICYVQRQDSVIIFKVKETKRDDFSFDIREIFFLFKIFN